MTRWHYATCARRSLSVGSPWPPLRVTPSPTVSGSAASCMRPFGTVFMLPWASGPRTSPRSLHSSTSPFMIGLAIMFPVIALLHASALEGMGLPQATSIAFGAGALALAVAYAALGCWVQRVELFGFVLKVPGPITTFAQIGLSLADLTLAGAVFFMCLPDSAAASYPHVLAVFVVALTAGIISHVPGGLGVFETIILMGL